MKNYILLLSVVLALVGCHKSDSPAPTYQSTSSSVGLVFEQTYHMVVYNNPYPTVFDTLVFHSNSTVTENLNGVQNTYPIYAVVTPNTDGTLQNNISIGIGAGASYYNGLLTALTGDSSQLGYIGTYKSGEIYSVHSTASLGIIFPDKGGYACYGILN